jgi:hypothetical protein
MSVGSEKLVALSDYLTSNEWDACYYAVFGYSMVPSGNFGESMNNTIQKLLESGYKFEGLDEKGRKKHQVQGSENAKKLVHIFFGEKNGISVADVLDNGRTFLKGVCPEMVSENDYEWEHEILPDLRKATGNG